LQFQPIGRNQQIAKSTAQLYPDSNQMFFSYSVAIFC
jgi:hypothetical protein